MARLPAGVLARIVGELEDAVDSEIAGRVLDDPEQEWTSLEDVKNELGLK